MGMQTSGVIMEHLGHNVDQHQQQIQSECLNVLICVSLMIPQRSNLIFGGN